MSGYVGFPPFRDHMWKAYFNFCRESIDTIELLQGQALEQINTREVVSHKLNIKLCPCSINAISL